MTSLVHVITAVCQRLFDSARVFYSLPWSSCFFFLSKHLRPGKPEVTESFVTHIDRHFYRPVTRLARTNEYRSRHPCGPGLEEHSVSFLFSVLRLLYSKTLRGVSRFLKPGCAKLVSRLCHLADPQIWACSPPKSQPRLQLKPAHPSPTISDLPTSGLISQPSLPSLLLLSSRDILKSLIPIILLVLSGNIHHLPLQSTLGSHGLR